MAEEENQDDLVEEDVLVEKDASVQEEEIGLFGTIGDVLMGIPRGVEEVVKGSYGLVDMGVNFIGVDLPDYGDKITGEPRTTAGSISEGIVNFGAGFVPVFGWMGRGGQIAQGVRLTSGLSKAAAAAKTTKLGSAAVTAGLPQQVQLLTLLLLMFIQVICPLLLRITHSLSLTEIS